MSHSVLPRVQDLGVSGDLLEPCRIGPAAPPCTRSKQLSIRKTSHYRHAHLGLVQTLSTVKSQLKAACHVPLGIAAASLGHEQCRTICAFANDLQDLILGGQQYEA